MTEALRNGLHVERVADEAGLAALQEPWARLIADVPHNSIFLTWEWIATWWMHREPGWELWLLAAWDGERLVGLAPWMLTRERLGPIPVRRLAFARNSGMSPNHMDVIARPADEDAVCERLMAYLQEHGREWDLLDLEALAYGSRIRDCAAHARGRFIEREPSPSLYITLPESWTAYEQEFLSANRRQQVRSRARRLERDHPGQVAYHRVDDPAELPSALDCLVRLNERRWHEKGLHASFDDPHFVAFQRAFAPLALERGWLRFYLLKVAGQVIAAEYCFRYRGVFVNYQRGFDLNWDGYSPGLLLYAHAIREAIEEGACEFDMLRGAHDYKRSWAGGERSNHHPVLSRSWQGHASLLGGALFDTAQSVGRRTVPKSVRERINRLLSGRR